MSWISVKERLPDCDEILFSDGVEVNYGAYGFYTLNDFCKYTSAGAREVEGVTHWMPLPEPPKE